MEPPIFKLLKSVIHEVGLTPSVADINNRHLLLNCVGGDYDGPDSREHAPGR